MFAKMTKVLYMHMPTIFVQVNTVPIGNLMSQLKLRLNFCVLQASSRMPWFLLRTVCGSWRWWMKCADRLEYIIMLMISDNAFAMNDVQFSVDLKSSGIKDKHTSCHCTNIIYMQLMPNDCGHITYTSHSDAQRFKKS